MLSSKSLVTETHDNPADSLTSPEVLHSVSFVRPNRRAAGAIDERAGPAYNPSIA